MKNYLIVTDRTVYDLEINDEKLNWDLSLYMHGIKRGEKKHNKSLPNNVLNDDQKLQKVIEDIIKNLNERLIAIYLYNKNQDKYYFQNRRPAVCGKLV